MKDKIYNKLTNLRDITFMPKPMVDLIDWLRYEIFFPYEE